MVYGLFGWLIHTGLMQVLLLNSMLYA